MSILLKQRFHGDDQEDGIEHHKHRILDGRQACRSPLDETSVTASSTKNMPARMRNGHIEAHHEAAAATPWTVCQIKSSNGNTIR